MNRWAGAIGVAILAGAMLPRSSPPTNSKELAATLKIIASFECDSEECEKYAYKAINKCVDGLDGKITPEEADETAICYIQGPGKRAALKACEDSQVCKKLIHLHFHDCIASEYDSKKFWNTSKNRALGEKISECILRKGGYSS